MENFRREYEVAPGIYLTPSSSSGDPQDPSSSIPVSPEAYILSLRAQGLLIEPIIASERKRLESLIRKLQDTNEELRTESDPEMIEIVRENDDVIRKYTRMIQLMEAEIGPLPGIFL